MKSAIGYTNNTMWESVPAWSNIKNAKVRKEIRDAKPILAYTDNRTITSIEWSSPDVCEDFFILQS